MYTRFRVAGLSVVAAALCACQPTETAEQMQARMQLESDSARAAIEAQTGKFVEAFNAGNVEGAVAIYTQDANVMAPNMPAMVGRDAIQAGFAAMMPTMPPGTKLALKTGSVVANGPIAIERGNWTMTTPMGDSTGTMMGKYLVHWHNVNGEWLMADDIWNDDAPPPPPPAAAPAATPTRR